MIDDDAGLRKRPRQRRQVGKLVEIEPGVEGQAELANGGETRAEPAIRNHPRPSRIGGVPEEGIGVPGGDVPNTAKAYGVGGDMRLENRLHVIPRRQIREADDGGAQGEAL